MGELAIPGIVDKILSNTGYYDGENIGFVAKEGTRCKFFYMWSIEEYGLWFTLFFATCVKVRLWVAVVCPDQIHFNKKSTTRCEFSKSSELEYNDVAAIFRTEMGVVLPPPPSP